MTNQTLLHFLGLCPKEQGDYECKGNKGECGYDKAI